MWLEIIDVGSAYFLDSLTGIKVLKATICPTFCAFKFEENNSYDQLFLIASQSHMECDTTMGPSQVDRKFTIEHHRHQKHDKTPFTRNTGAFKVKVTLIMRDTYYGPPLYILI